MKLSFSTLGCPDWTLNESIAISADLGYNGIEIRGVADEMYAPRIPAFGDSLLEKTKQRFARASLSVPILTSGAFFADQKDVDGAMTEAKEYLLLASKMGVPYIRVMGECSPEPRNTKELPQAVTCYKELCRYAAPLGVMPLIETNGVLADSKTMLSFLSQVDEPNMGVLWDIHHTFRFYDEAPADTVKALGSYIRHVHVKDSVRGRNGVITYMLNGYGDVPIEESVSSLRAIGFDGFYSYEWVKRWSRELAEPGIAFHKYISFMRELED